MNLKEVIHEFCGTSNIEFYMIHLEKAVERIPIIKDFFEKINTELRVFNAADGKILIESGHPTKCFDSIDTSISYRSAGDIGCVVSHVNICKDAIEKGYDYAVIFEDDVEMVSSLNSLDIGLRSFKLQNKEFDMFLLGGDPILNSTNIAGSAYSIIKGFNHTHAYIINRKMMLRLIERYEEYCKMGLAYSIDGMYSKILNENKESVYGFTRGGHYVRQKSGMYSYILEGVR